MSHASVLIVSDAPEFATALAARWQAERLVPEITLVTSDVWHPTSEVGYEMVIVGPVRPGKATSIFHSLGGSPSTAGICVVEEEAEIPALREEFPQLPILPRRDGWANTVILLSSEALRRVASVVRAQRAERQAIESQGHAALGRYMLEMRPSVNNALTSVLGNADLLLLEPGQASGDTHEQIQTIHRMALRLNEIMQRFSSLASEVRAGEKESQVETSSEVDRLLIGS